MIDKKQNDIPWEERNAQEWRQLINTIFPGGRPNRFEWETPQEISDVLNVIGSIKNSNHTFFPSAGGLDLQGCKVYAGEKGCIELDFGIIPYIAKPAKLIFEAFDDDNQWNYFRLELDQLPKMVEDGDAFDFFDEQVTEVTPGKYMRWEEKEYYPERLPENARIIVRLLKGSLVTFQKSSQYNRRHGKLDAYDARHNKMSANEFRDYIGKYKTGYNDWLASKNQAK